MNRSTTALRVFGVLVSVSVIAAPAAARQQGPSTKALLTGFGAVSYSGNADSDFQSDFTTNLSPVFLFKAGSDFLVESEMDIELEGGETSVHLEHAQIHYLGFENVQITAGRFHLPFGLWMHPDWVNHMPTPPLLYEDTHGAPATEGLMPIPFDVGVKVAANLPLFQHWRTSATLWVSQGPAGGVAPHVHGATGTDPVEPTSDAALLAYGVNYEDNNSDKMVGLRLKGVSAGGVTLQASGFRAAYDDAGELGIYGSNVALIWAPRAGADPLFDLRGEGTLFKQEFIDDSGAMRSVRYGGHYVQISRRMGALEPIARWSYLPRVIAGEGPIVDERRQVALGLNYWFAPSIPFKAAYNVELDGTDGFFLQWAVGF